jgi:aspartyl-tRNA(Asn)/glutamyl-tRNA(Gln) amidotransferase subunit B
MPDQTTKDVRITQIQLEQDSAKSIHDQHPEYSLIDLNRAGSALIEIVTEADMRFLPGGKLVNTCRSSMEAFLFIKKLQHLVRRVGVSTANMDEVIRWKIKE